MNFERPEGSFFSRRNIARGALVVGVLGGFAAAAIGLNKAMEAGRDTLANFVPIESFRPCYGQEIPGLRLRSYLTDPVVKGDLVAVRNEPNSDPDNIIGWAPAEQSIRAKAHYGFPYIGGSLSSNGLGVRDCVILDENGERIDEKNSYGAWYKAQEVGIEVLDENGNKILLPRFNKYIKGLDLMPEYPDTENSAEVFSEPH